MGTIGETIVRRSKPSNAKRLCFRQGQGHTKICPMLLASLWSAWNHFSVKKQCVTSLKRLQRLKLRNEKRENVETEILVCRSYAGPKITGSRYQIVSTSDSQLI